MAGFFETLKNMQGDSGESLPSFLSTHPDPAHRADELVKYINAKGYALI